MTNILLNYFEREAFEKTVRDAYNKHDKIVFVFDLSNSEKEIKLSTLLKDVMPIVQKYEDQAVKKLERNIFIAPRTWQRVLIRGLIKACNSKIPYEIFDSVKLS